MIPGLLEAIVSIGGFVFPSVIDLVKKVVVGKEKDTVEATLSTLATTKPEVLPNYIKAVADNRDSETRWFNRDIAGVPSQVIIDIRGGIRPAATIFALIGLIIEGFGGVTLDAGTRATFCGLVSSWFGDRVTTKAGR